MAVLQFASILLAISVHLTTYMYSNLFDHSSTWNGWVRIDFDTWGSAGSLQYSILPVFDKSVSSARGLSLATTERYDNIRCSSLVKGFFF